MGARMRRWTVIAAGVVAVACGSSSGGDLYGPGKPDAAAGGSGGSGGSAGGSAGASASGGAAGAGTDGGGSAGMAGDASAGATSTGGSAGTDAGTSGAGGAAGTTGTGGAGGTGGGTAPGMGQIQCGAATCNVATQNCCRSILGGCQPNFPPLCTGAQVHCDDSNDCPQGVCCASKGLAGWGARCDTTCGANGSVVLCRASSSCDSGLTCKAFSSLPGFDACQP